ncbi:MAG: Gfo/Idh/MocA family oxidoreductase [Phycisphaerales bacterium]|nr:Gfo/Idh/MocA family oxidoreductase [Phycisphaerales bacterium]
MVDRLSYAMIGGGIGAFIGEVHRRAISLDDRATLVAGALSSTPEKSKQSAAQLGLDPDRSYGSYEELFERESARDDRVDFVSIVTPNDTHYPIAKMALKHGFHVVLDKPATHTSEQANELASIAESNGLVCCVTYNYTGYPMVRQARAMIAAGELGTIRKVYAEYHQGWLASDLEVSGQKQAAWRVDPKRAGLGGALGDIGTHAENLLAFVTGLEIQTLHANLNSFVPGRALDDDASVMMQFTNGAHGVLTASQICIGEGNGLTLRVHGDRGSLWWRQESPDELRVALLDQNPVIYSRGGAGLHDDAAISARIPQGHPEGYLEAFGNIYKGAIDAIFAKRDGHEPSRLAQLIPSIVDGERGVRFVERCVQSAKKNAQLDWA